METQNVAQIKDAFSYFLINEKFSHLKEYHGSTQIQVTTKLFRSFIWNLLIFMNTYKIEK